ncbi:hypothetical protein [Streptomyces orinoci]|uniref:Uncharacterized protein n=1 Tax=Streptomyces orinoci TaxID=67339 RepID=A0ABV3K128_STRON|nr:hypothetical protein [Streptomyces orinoci]
MRARTTQRDQIAAVIVEEEEPLQGLLQKWISLGDDRALWRVEI